MQSNLIQFPNRKEPDPYEYKYSWPIFLSLIAGVALWIKIIEWLA